ncbi:hypothetical protein [Methanosphaerula palustris]|uniref:Uncharacterized protein n=1 Tax=Methanosphaerula palustris (strain ATCC BAA-1556 / DSM 19958 / E1-9c) TaxID=521011 RepID=B8GKV0_METPE|nr:hypothetical protein [Methanosphaerula palustris]ACL17246.1 hypothetical protein Mpal_1942 [Methanosphaerula palustris E1-9c]
MKTIYSLAILLVLLFLSAGCTSQGTDANHTGNQTENQTVNQSETAIIGSWVESGDSQNILIQFQENGTAQMRFRSTAGSTNDTFVDRIGHWEQTGSNGLVNLSYLGPTSNESRVLTMAVLNNGTALVKRVYNGTQETTSASGPDLSFRRAEWPSQSSALSLDNPLKK